MSDFFKELEEEIREERIVVLWRKYGTLIITLAVCIVLGTAGYSTWNYMKHQGKLRRHVSFSQAVTLMNQGKKEDALKAFQAITQEGGGYAKLAKLYEAALLQNPVELYTQMTVEYATDPALGNLPKVLRASRELGNAEAMASLQPLTAPQNAWAPLSRELLALADLKQGDDAKAAEQYLKLMNEPSLTNYEQARAGMMLSQIDIPPGLLEKEASKEGKQ